MSADDVWDCLSCGAHAQTKPYCESCGAAQPVAGDDSALSMMLGLVCESCDAYNDPGVAVCVSCGKPLPVEGPIEPPVLEPLALTEIAPEAPPLPPSWMTPPTGQPLQTAFVMKKVDLSTVATGAEGAGVAAPRPTPAPVESPPKTGGVCVKCATQLAPDDKFCRNCGHRVGEMPAPAQSAPWAAAAAAAAQSGVAMSTQMIAAAKLPSPSLASATIPQGATMIMPQFRAAQTAQQGPSATMFFGAVTAERSAKLVLVRGQSQFGSQWRLQAGETVVGRSEGMVLFPDDIALAPRHCRLVFRDNDLWLEPEDTQNGVFVRLREPTKIVVGDEVVVGAQRLRVLADEDRPIRVPAQPDTCILGSLVKPVAAIQLLRIADDPVCNEVYYRCQRLLTIGRNNCDLNFPRDSFVSERHAQLTNDNDSLVVEDLRSRNGTYLRARASMQLLHGDLVLLGDKVLRVELPR